MIKEFIKSLPFDERVKMQQEINSNPSIREAMRGIIEPTASIAASVGLQEEQDYPDDKSNFLEVIKPHASCKPVLMFAIMLLNEGVEHIRSVIDDRMDTDHIDARIAELIDECNQLMKPKKKKTSR
jgi:DNA gyrase/topoisomerase IV subunit A